MKHLAYLNKFFLKYIWWLIPGLIFVIISNVFQVLQPRLVRVAFDLVIENVSTYQALFGFQPPAHDLRGFWRQPAAVWNFDIDLIIAAGPFSFFMRQTIILMSRHIEYDLKNEIYNHYQELSLAFFRRHNTGDLMNRVTEDVSRVRMYLGPGIMYTINTVVLFIMVIYAMLAVNVRLAVFSVLPLPILAVIIYYVNNMINQRSERIQERLSILSAFVQENFSGIRVIKSYVREAFARKILRPKVKIIRLTRWNWLKYRPFFTRSC